MSAAGENIKLGEVINKIVNEFATKSFVRSETDRLEVMINNVEAKIDTVIEIVTDNTKVKHQVIDHEYRLIDIEKVQPMMIKTLKMHSKKLDSFYER